MKVNRFSVMLLLACCGSATSWSAQSDNTERAPGQSEKADHQVFDQVRAKAEKGDAQAQLELGFLYSSGIGVGRDPVKATKWHRKAAEQGLARAEYQLSMDYANGDGVKKPDLFEAAKWMRRAADQGLPEAELGIGLCYANGNGVHASSTEAIAWYRKAADKGYAAAAYELGNCCFEGAGTPKDIVEGVKWVRQAAEQGYPPAQNKLGLCYEQGTGLSKDYVEAYKWFSLAAAQDDALAPDIRVNLAKVEARLTKEQVSEAQRLAREFKSGQTPRVNAAPAEAFTAPPTAPAVQTGAVNVMANDESYEVYVDGAFVGNPPAKLKLVEGVHVVEVKKAGFQDFRREIKVSGGADLSLRVVLTK
jgi:TPR repeat protein